MIETKKHYTELRGRSKQSRRGVNTAMEKRDENTTAIVIIGEPNATSDAHTLHQSNPHIFNNKLIQNGT
jgi:hypothetical protein